MIKNPPLNWLIFLLLLPSYYSYSQEIEDQSGKHKIGITFSSFGENDVIRFKILEGAASYNSNQFYSLGLNYMYPLNRWLELESGFEYAKHTITVEPNLPPNIDFLPYKANLSIINIPIGLRLNFLKYFYLNGGLILDIDASLSSPIDNQTGIGAQLGFGVKYDFKGNLSVFINPYLKLHALIPFSTGNYPQRLMESGIRIGIMYKLQEN